MLSNYKFLLERILGRILKKNNIMRTLSPNFLTFIGLITSLLILFLVEYYNVSLSFLILLILVSALMDVLDGYIAREFNKMSKFGAFLDSTSDRISDGIYAYIFLKIGIINNLLFFALIIGFFLTSYCRARAEGIGIEMKGIGLIERGERIIFILIILITSYFSKVVSRYLSYILLLLTYVTVFQRIYHVYESTRG